MTTVSDESLAGLANLYGLEVAYADGLGGDRVASRDAIVAVLRGLGAEIAGDKDVPAAARARRETLTGRLAEPVAVVWEGADPDIELHVDTRARKVTWSLELEGGERRSGVGRVTDLEAAGPARDGRRRRNLRLSGPLPLGYHRLTVEVGRRRADVTVIAAPRRAYRPPEVEANRAWGLFAPAYALHSAREMPIGDLADLETLARWTADLGGSFVGTLPLLAAFLDEPFAPSPYQPASRLFWNELFVALDRLPEARHLGLADREFRARATALRDAELVDYREAMRLKRVALERASGLAFEQEQRRRQIESWADHNPAAIDYARFRAAMERHGTDRGRWPGPLRDGDVREEDGDLQAQRYHLYVQHAMQAQIAEVAESNAGLYLDLPLGVHAHGYDTWRQRELFVGAAAAGAPPDALSRGGQNWGFPGLHPEQSRLRGHAYFAACLRHHMRAATALRIDHVMGLHRLFLIPDGFQARDGVYLRYPVEELYAVVCLESVRNRCMVVGEDLGTVPPAVRPMLAEHGLHRMYVGQFELDTEAFAALRPVPPNSVASFGTHDTAAFAGYWQANDVDDHVELGGIPAQQGEAERQRRQEIERALRRFLDLPGAPDRAALLRGVLRHLATGSAAALLVTLEDLWLEPRPQNVPGTTEERPNWRRKLDRSLEAVQADPHVTELLGEVDDLRRGSHAIASSEAKQRTMTGSSPQLTDDDIYLFNEGTHARLYQKLGAQPMSEDGVAGTQFAVWAPNADSVSVIGDFNGWNDSSHPLQPIGSSGIWRAFVAGVGHGALYKYRIRPRFGGAAVSKADPLGQSQETPPRTASRVWESGYTWGDGSWMRGRRERNHLDAPISIYEVHLGSWRRVPEDGNRSLSYRELAPQLADYVGELGFSHVEFLPVMEHPFYGSWGYQVTGYFAPSGRFGTPDDFRYLVDHLHQRGIGVILDWVPAHFPTDEHGLGDFDGTHLYEHADPRRGFHPDWKSYIFNYDRNEVRSFLMSSATYWLDQFHADGLRVDGVASMLYLDYSRGEGEWVPNELGGRENLGAISLLRQVNEAVYRDFPDVQMIAEESTAWPMVSRPTYVGGLGFGFKWDMGWMHDTLRYMAHEPIHRRYHHNELTFRGIYAFTENYVLPLSHDEVVHGKGSLLGRMPGDDWQKHANLRALLAAMWAQPGKKLLFMGGEIAQWAEWDHDSSVEWHLLDHVPHRGTRDLVAELNRLYRKEAALHLHDVRPEGFEWVDANDAEQSVLSFLRRGTSPNDVVLVVCNLTPIPRHDYAIGVPSGGVWKEILNTDAEQYGGSGVGNSGSVEASGAGCHGRPFSLRLALPPLGVLYLAPSAA